MKKAFLTLPIIYPLLFIINGSCEYEQEGLIEAGCYLLSNVTYNHVSESRNISMVEEYDPRHGVYLLHVEVWEEPGQNLTVFSKTNTLSLKIDIVDDKHNPKNINKVYTNIIILPPNTEKKIFINLTSDDPETYFIEKSTINSFGMFVR
ncbi:hypothetical protein RF11_12798 [Thelohanellus kitauei]|uniref:Uncharacterized protein n=1 Tax=Thelohanellus kitauei TaxID=669202 RepID=A0A0C2MAM3_THEKT|nr:hypothetical protein RF11_12798 [Thelohanellus kitauei]